MIPIKDNCKIVWFEFKSLFDVHFQPSTLGKIYEPPYPSLGMGEIVPLLFFCKAGVGIK